MSGPTAGGSVSLRFVLFGVACWVLFHVMKIAGVLGEPALSLDSTWFGAARAQLGLTGFFGPVMFGAVYHILPRLLPAAGRDAWDSRISRLARVHFWLLAAGVVLLVVPLGVAGAREAIALRDGHTAFMNVVRITLMFLRVSTVGDLLLLTGNAVFVLALFGRVLGFYRVRAVSAYAAVTADFKPAEART